MDGVLEWLLLVGPAIIIGIALVVIVRWGKRTNKIRKVDMRKIQEGHVDRD